MIVKKLYRKCHICLTLPYGYANIVERDYRRTGESSNGRIPVSKTVNLGSNPSTPGTVCKDGFLFEIYSKSSCNIKNAVIL